METGLGRSCLIRDCSLAGVIALGFRGHGTLAGPCWSLPGEQSVPRFVAVVFLACSALGAQAQEAATEAAPEPRDDGLGFFSGDYELAEPEGYSVKFEPFVWYVSPGGDVGFGGDTPLVDTSDLSLDNPWVSGGAELHLGKDKWRLSLLGAHSQQNGDSVANSALMLNTLPVAAGDTIHAEFDMTVASVRAGYEVWSFAASRTTRASRGSAPHSRWSAVFEHSITVLRVKSTAAAPACASRATCSTSNRLSV